MSSPKSGPLESSQSNLPRSELAPGYSVARIINGGWQLSHGHHPTDVERDKAVEILQTLARSGLTSFDGADIYGGVEELFGHLRKSFSGQVEIHTKCVPDRSTLPTLTRRQVEKIIDRSLRRLGAEHIDLVQFHWWDWEIPEYVQTAQWLADLQRAGKIAHLGVTNFDFRHLKELIDAGIPIISNQVQYSLLDRRPERDLVGFCTKHGISLLSYGTLAGGFLTEKFIDQPPPPLAANRSQTKYRLMIEEFGGWESYQELLEILSQVARRHNVGISSVAARWALDRPSVAAAIIGARTAEHITAHQQTFGLALSAEDLASINGFLEEHPGPAGPVFGLERQPAGAHQVIMKTELNRSQS